MMDTNIKNPKPGNPGCPTQTEGSFKGSIRDLVGTPTVDGQNPALPIHYKEYTIIPIV